MFARDRDLLIYEPELFRDVRWLGQRLTGGSGDLSGTTLTVASPEVGFDAAGVGAGSVALVGGAAYEVIERTGATTLVISRLRASDTDAPVAGVGATGAAVEVFTFAPQIAATHRAVMRMAGVEPDAASGVALGRPSAEAVTNGASLRRLEAFGALHLIFSGASAPGEEAWAARAALYRERFAGERARAVVMLDLDGDGKADAARRLNVVQFVRG